MSDGKKRNLPSCLWALSGGTLILLLAGVGLWSLTTDKSILTPKTTDLLTVNETDKGTLTPKETDSLTVPSNVQALINVIIDIDRNSSIRRLAIEALGYIQSKEAVQPLINIIKTDTNIEVRRSAIYALRNIHSRDNRRDNRYSRGCGKCWRDKILRMLGKRRNRN